MNICKYFIRFIIFIKGFGIRNKYAISMFDIGSSMEDIFGAEHKAKMFIINTTRRLFDENDIM